MIHKFGIRTFYRESKRIAPAYGGGLIGNLRWIPHWVADRVRCPDPIASELPWTTRSAVTWLRANISPSWRVFEWGTGGSTAFFVRSGVKELVSVEHDRHWYALVKSALKNDAHQCVLIEPEPLCDESARCSFQSSHPNHNRACFRRYCEHILEYPDDYFDLVMIDGRAREACFRLAMSKLRPRGYILWDDTDRTRYRKCILEVGPDWKAVELGGPKFGAIGWAGATALEKAS